MENKVIDSRKGLAKAQSGFAAIEIVLLVVIVSVIGGIGYYVVSQNKSKNASTSQTVAPAKIGTIGDIENKNNATLKDELKAEDDSANQETAAANAEVSANQSIGDGYETSF